MIFPVCFISVNKSPKFVPLRLISQQDFPIPFDRVSRSQGWPECHSTRSTDSETTRNLGTSSHITFQ